MNTILHSFLYQGTQAVCLADVSRRQPERDAELVLFCVVIENKKYQHFPFLFLNIDLYSKTSRAQSGKELLCCPRKSTLALFWNDAGVGDPLALNLKPA